jgi:hypothetical protein
MSTIGSRRVDYDQPPTMATVAIPPEVVDGSLGVLHEPVTRPSPEEQERRAAEQARAAEHHHRQRVLATLEHVRGQTPEPVSAADVMHTRLNPLMTLADAHRRLEDAGGAVRPAGEGTLRFSLPLSLHPEPLTAAAIRAEALEAVVVLDACRALVHSLPSAKRALPDRLPGAGGSVA